VVGAAAAPTPCDAKLDALQRRLDALEGKAAAPTMPPAAIPAAAARAPSAAFSAKCLVCHGPSGQKPTLSGPISDADAMRAIRNVLSGKMPPSKSGIAAPNADEAGEILEALTGK
jgi:hypothetical protein